MSYSQRFLTHFLWFNRHFACLPLEGASSYVLALSAGVDSQVLLWLMGRLREKYPQIKLKGVHIDHALRPESKEECRFVLKRAESDFQIECDPYLWEKKQVNNIEMAARKFRYECYKKSRFNRESLILTGHHIDDSWEWSLLCQLRGSNPRRGLGIPYKNGVFRRPLMAFSKEQIYRLAQEEGIPFYEDASNQNLNFERNYIRQKITPLLKARHPKFLQHYVRRSNEMARSWGLSGQRQGEEQVFHYKYSSELVVQELTSQAQTYLRDSIQRHSLVNRGEIAREITNFLKGISAKGWGPHAFSGGVKVYNAYGHLLVLREPAPRVSTVESKRRWDYRSFKESFEGFLEKKNDCHHYPYWCAVSRAEFRLPAVKRKHPLWKELPPVTSSQQRISALRLLHFWKKYPEKKLNITCFFPIGA